MDFKPDDGMTEFSQLFNFDQATVASQAQKGKTVVSPPQFVAPGPENAYIPPQQPTFQGPSHQYELFRQHTSLAPGAFSSMQRNRQQMPTQSYDVPIFEMNDADGASFGGMDMDFPDMFDANSVNGFVDPSSVGAGSEAGDASPVAQPVQRLWPGSHQQHAAAKEQQKKLEQQEQQKLQEQQRIAISQQQLGTSAQHAATAAHTRRPSQARSKPTDPLVEERISQILRSMRQNNSRPNNASTPPPATNQAPRQRKDEEDMDEDERLLASEEGKKLSSKERRQLRNKVSARAFRSRRKEYISQLEGELQVKTQEADELQFDNDALRAENAQLTDLARMLLSQPAFNNVIEDLAARGSPMAVVAAQTNQHRGSIQQAHTPIPAQPVSQPPISNGMDFSTPMDGWNSGITAPDFNFNPNVFAVTKLPEPVISTDILSGKESSDLPGIIPSSFDCAKTEYPVVDRSTPKADRPVIESSGTDPDDLYEDSPVKRQEPIQSSDKASTTRQSISENLSSKNTHQHVELVSIEDSQTLDRTLDARFKSLCLRLDDMCERIEGMTSRS